MGKRFGSAIVLIGFVLASHVAYAWDKSDALWESAFLAVHTLDWGQTLDIASQCDTGAYQELNPFLGQCPSVSEINQYFISTAALHIGVAALLPNPYRKIFQKTSFALRLGVVANNARIGLRVNF